MRGSPGHTLRFELSKSDERGRKNPQLHTGKTGFIIQGKSYSRVWRDEIAHAGVCGRLFDVWETTAGY